MLVITLLLMMWASMARMHELPVHYPPCFFNPLCTCSKAMPDLGRVACYSVPMPRIPQAINSSKMYMLQLENNGLRFLQPQYLMNTGLYQLQIKHNPLADIPEEAFLGLERSLSMLDLSYNQLANIPSKSFRHLQKLEVLELTGNKISRIVPKNWRGLENSLQTLRLGKNAIEKLPADAFVSLTYLEILDLRENSLKEIDPSVFRDGMAHLTHFYLNDNQLTYVPYIQLFSLKRMKVLDLSYNKISKMLHAQQEPEVRGIQMSLDVLQLDYNQIKTLASGDFQHFYKVNRTYLRGNPLMTIEEGTFKDSRIRELYLSDCDLLEINSANLAGLESSLELLDVSGNNITMLPNRLFQEFDLLHTLIFRENRINTFSPTEVFSGFQYLYNLDLSGKQNGMISLQDLRQMRNLRFLSISRMPQAILSANDFLEFGMDIKELRIINSNLNTIKNHAFMHVGYSLLTLRMSHGLSSSISEIPNRPFKSLRNLQHLDLSNNKIRSLSATSFHFLNRIKRIELQDNEIDSILKGTFQGEIHSTLEEINFAFNQVRDLQTHTFIDLSALMTINLEDNTIERIERRAFINMNRLKYINLRGNKIRDITDEAFQNLPDLEFLDLAYNNLNEFDFASFDQVGTLSSFKVNVSHNEISRLWVNSTSFTPSSVVGGNVQSNIKVLDLSYNNISDIAKYYFKPVEYSLTHLYLSNNQLRNITQDVFGNMAHLQWLDLRHNELIEIYFDCLKNTNNLQVLLFSWNEITDIPAETLRSLKKLRIVDLSHNKLRTLPDNMFTDSDIESLDLSHNQFTRLPVKSMSVTSTANLANLDMSWNILSGIHTTDTIFRLRVTGIIGLWFFEENEVTVTVNSDRLSSRLVHLDRMNLMADLLIILFSLKRKLLYLGLSNISLLSIPELPLRRLQTLNLAYNGLASISPEMSSNLTSLHYLDLSYNDLTVVPLITHTLPELKTFNLANNPITAITNTSFLGVADSLEELDIRKLSLSIFERHRHESIFLGRSTLQSYQTPQTIHYCMNSVRIKIRFTEHIIFVIGVRNPHLHFSLYNTSVAIVPREIFRNAQRVRNVTVEIRNSDIRSLHNPSSSYKPGVPGQRFLMKLRLADSHINCDCDIGWIEIWQRKHRQYQEDQCISYDEFHNFEREEVDEFNCWDNGWDDDIRETFCLNKNNVSLSNLLKTELECGWAMASTIELNTIFLSQQRSCRSLSHYYNQGSEGIFGTWCTTRFLIGS
ncbi:Chaoptin [Trachymyrmex cornetzi]|uniref:Chaoptin n=1 Tax=Trachymyrmex cornetzi TaxID=471704 RepID=A0A195DZQ7_9HYME|nr:Chaoptin [Trachymyrmex cornetzi]